MARRKFRVVAWSDKETREILFHGILFKKEGKWCGLAEGNKPMEFKSKAKAFEFGDKYFAQTEMQVDHGLSTVDY